KDVVGAQRFLQRLWRLVVDETTGEITVSDAELNDEDLKQLHRTVAGIRDDYDHLRANTAVAKLIEYTNYLTKNYGKSVPRAAIDRKSTRLNSSHVSISYAVFCLKTKPRSHRQTVLPPHRSVDA